MTDIGLWAIAAQKPDRPAVIEPDGTVVSYTELAARADKIGRGLQALGLRPGDCVAGMLSNSSAVLALFFAAMETGLYVVPANWHLAAAEVAYILGDSGAGAFVADERFAAGKAELRGAQFACLPPYVDPLGGSEFAAVIRVVDRVVAERAVQRAAIGQLSEQPQRRRDGASRRVGRCA